MRKELSGDRDAAATYLGLAQSRLAEMKTHMALGGLQQMMRNLTMAGGVELTVASMFGQDYVAIHVPLASVVVTEADTHDDDAVRVANFIKATFKDEVRRTGAISLAITRPQPPLAQANEVITIGNDYDREKAVGLVNGRMTYLSHYRAWVNSSVTGKRYLDWEGAGFGFIVNTMSADGQRFGGEMKYSYPVQDPFGGGVAFYSLYARAWQWDYGAYSLTPLGVTSTAADSRVTSLGGSDGMGSNTTNGHYTTDTSSTDRLFRHDARGVAAVAGPIPAPITTVSLARPSIPQPDITTYLTYSA